MTRGISVRPFAVLALFGSIVLAMHFGCTPEPEQTRLIPNQPPETIVTGAPLDSSNTFHRFQLFWSGFDVDGTIAGYYVAVTDSNIAPVLRDYQPTTRSDTIIEFTANNEVVLSHAFWVFAVDNEGDRDESPARVFFNAVDTNRPLPLIVEAEKFEEGIGWTPLRLQTPTDSGQDTVSSAGSQVRIRWTATDPDVGGAIAGYRVKLNFDSQFSEIPADSTSIVYENMASGNYQFLVHAIDNAGAESLDPASLRWVVNHEPETMITQMYVSNLDGFFEVTDFHENPPTVRDSSRITLFFVGDDQDGEVIDYAVRRIRCDIVRLSCQSRPFGSFFTDPFVSTPEPASGFQDTTSLFYTSNDYFLVVRSRDNEGKTDGTPDSVFFHVNFTPELDPARLYPGDGAVINRAGQDSLDIRFYATDIETVPVDMTYRVVLDGVWGQTVGPVPTEDDLFERWAFPDTGLHQLEYTVTDPGRRSSSYDVTFTVIDE